MVILVVFLRDFFDYGAGAKVAHTDRLLHARVEHTGDIGPALLIPTWVKHRLG